MTTMNLAFRTRHLFIFSCIFSLIISGCQTTSVDLSKLTPDERRLRQQQDEFNRTVVEGALAGALAGALLGAMLSKDKKKGALGGAAAGGVVGAGAGYYVASQKDGYSNKIAHLNKMTSDVDADNAKLTNYIATTERVIADNKARIETAEQKVASGQISKAALKEELQRAESNRQVVGQALEKLKTNRREYINASNQYSRENPSTDKSELDRKIVELQGNITKLEGEYEELTRLLQAHRLG